ncbi:MAG TPA: hypothetical protein VGC91_17195 [Pyrinomonadaceae bacterium]
MKRRTEITIEIERVLVFSQRTNHEARCADCDAEASLITASEAATLAGTTVHAIFRRAEAGTLHSSVTQAGALLICLTSLLRDEHSFHGAVR